ncbi:hypothetical protein NQ317_004832 [Molorchus minor]|uniref:DUF4806 domain-containing protein n=1 Tax=Molorchus minor TaxID=1323400 RepID=A0ABQ9IR36_9CUCU|nr:hypothetical protein NQ317_004832 [Molorchus minor]
MGATFIGVEFDERDGGGVGLVHYTWLTPRKREVWWPPYKQQTAFEKALKKGEVPNETWTLCKVARSFFEEDVQSEIEDNEPTRRRISKPRRLSYSSDEEPLSALPLPPKIKAPNKYTPHKDVLSCTREVTSSPKSVISIESEGQASGTLAPPLLITKDVGPDFNAKFLSLLIHVKEQNSQILKILKTTKPVGVPIVNELPDDIPVQFPVSSFDDLKQVEEYLNDLRNLTAVASHFASLGGRDITTKSNTILRNTIKNELASKFSYLGSRNGKKAFSELNLKKVIIRAVQMSSPNTTENEIDMAIKIWLKHAPKRWALEKRKQNPDGN